MRQAEDKKQPSNETLKKQGHGGCFGRDGIKLVWILLTNPIRTPRPPLWQARVLCLWYFLVF